VSTVSESDPIEESHYSRALDRWRSYRVGRGEIDDTADYDKGFFKGYIGPPGLVDGSPYFNLGHSDGMLARRGEFPTKPDTGGDR
jgi:hypothetical protein